MTTTAGSLALEGSIPAKDAFVAQRLREAGAVILGKTNLSEWANFRSTHSTSGWSGRGGQARNPYALDRNPSGSSSGSGAAIAANFAAVGDRHRRPTARSSRRRNNCGLVGHQADARPREPRGHHPDRAQPGHRRPDGAHGRRRGRPARRAIVGRRSRTTRSRRPPRPRMARDYTQAPRSGGALKGARIGVPRKALLRLEPARPTALVDEAIDGAEGARAPMIVDPGGPADAGEGRPTASSRCCSTSSRPT